LGHVNAMSGYATTLSGEKLVFSMFGNNHTMRGRGATDVFDAICAAMLEELGKPAPGKTKKPKK
jgi:D-alanyl-D-alanine carboxypeptidase